jgi:hypothetical protein
MRAIAYGAAKPAPYQPDVQEGQVIDGAGAAVPDRLAQ